MGRPKALLPWGGCTLLEHQVDALLEGGADEVVVVLGHDAHDLAPYVRGPRARGVVNRSYRQGRASSVRAGAAALSPSVEHILLLAVDQPRTASLVSRVLQAHLEAGALITSPRYRGRGGHPLVFSAALREELESVTEEGQGVRQVLEAHRSEIHRVEMDDPMLRLDVNTPEEYRRAVERYGPRV